MCLQRTAREEVGRKESDEKVIQEGVEAASGEPDGDWLHLEK